jgi:hypothetical protein
MDPSNMQQFIAEQEAVADPDRAAAEALAAEKHQKYLLYHRAEYDRCREKVLAKRWANYQPTGRSVGRPRLPREYKILIT